MPKNKYEGKSLNDLKITCAFVKNWTSNPSQYPVLKGSEVPLCIRCHGPGLTAMYINTAKQKKIEVERGNTPLPNPPPRVKNIWDNCGQNNIRAKGENIFIQIIILLIPSDLPNEIRTWVIQVQNKDLKGILHSLGVILQNPGELQVFNCVCYFIRFYAGYKHFFQNQNQFFQNAKEQIRRKECNNSRFLDQNPFGGALRVQFSKLSRDTVR
ncbi:hypothetical protein GQR58_009470 [Nymphon striatum]|nr:hypothetical protein GQR58_009470 [Nymphon striatum]